MEEIKKNTLKNKLKNSDSGDKSSEKDNKPKKEKDLADHSSKSGIIEKIKAQFSFIQNERFQKIFGLTLLLFAVYLTIAFTSFAFTWEVDQDKVLGNLFSPEVRVENWLGKFGALISYVFIHKWFGAASYIFAFLAFITGLRITFNIGFINFRKAYAISFFLLVFISVTLGYIFSNTLFFLGGAFGYTISNKLNGFLGFIGTGVLLFFAFIVFLVAVFNISFDLSKKDPIIEDENEDAEVEINKSEEEKKTINTLKEIDEIDEVEEGEEDLTKKDDLIITNDERHDIIEEVEKPIATEEIVLSTSDTGVQFTVENIDKKEEELSPEQLAAALTAQVGEYDPTLDLSSYQFPSIDLLENYGGSKEIVINTDELKANKDKILKTLGDYGIEIEKIKATVGPTVTLYEIVPAAGVRISKIKNLEDDIALSLSALGIRIIAPIPGKGTIGIEVPNLNPEIVPMRTLLASEKFQNTTMDLPIALGKTISNETFITDLAKMPHLLMAGATGQGKSVGLNAVLVSLLYKKHPSQIKFVLVDPKKVELTLFNKIERHFLAKLPDSAEAIITDTKKVVHTLNSLCIEMDQRYDLLKEAQVRNIKEYNTKFIARRLNPNDGHKFLPYIVLVVDEFADLIMTAGKEVETPIARLAQLARAIGIHLIIATQRPSVNIITGTIKANFPARIAFRVTSKIDSRTILDSGGADQLIGRGDMLLSTGNDLIRLQCAFVDTPEVDRICDFIGAQRSYPTAFLLPEYVDENGEGTGKMDDPSERDGLFNQAAEIIVSTQQGSASLLQRRLKLGYNRAGRIIDQLESAGIIGPFEGSKAREVLIKDMLSLEQFLNKSDKN
ncbi:MAG: cell division protein FtsK [Bacteroidetes bacterium RIFCSPLOWO2_12_FULL_35_15]|nr:MAG: cell division protein FtsK [Bacteroidetes bacterium RIFCSPLOWO2_12_FULL_35_15]